MPSGERADGGHPIVAASASELAWMLEGLCRAGIDARASGWCLGELLRSELVIVPHRGGARAVRADGTREGYRRARRRAHERCGHDDTCEALGVPRGTLRRMLAAWDGVEARELMEEAMNEAVEDIAVVAGLEDGVGWSREEALEAVAHAIGRRITPRAPGPGRTAPPKEGGRAVHVERARPRILRNAARVATRFRGLPRTDRPRGAASPG